MPLWPFRASEPIQNDKNGGEARSRSLPLLATRLKKAQNPAQPIANTDRFGRPPAKSKEARRYSDFTIWIIAAMRTPPVEMAKYRRPLVFRLTDSARRRLDPLAPQSAQGRRNIPAKKTPPAPIPKLPESRTIGHHVTFAIYTTRGLHLRHTDVYHLINRDK